MIQTLKSWLKSFEMSFFSKFETGGFKYKFCMREKTASDPSLSLKVGIKRSKDSTSNWVQTKNLTEL